MTAINWVKSDVLMGSIEAGMGKAQSDAPETPDAPKPEGGQPRNDPESPLQTIKDSDLVVYNSDYVAITDIAKGGTVAVSNQGGAALYGFVRRHV